MTKQEFEVKLKLLGITCRYDKLFNNIVVIRRLNLRCIKNIHLYTLAELYELIKEKLGINHE